MKRLLPHLPLLAACATLGLSTAHAGTEQAGDSITPPTVEKTSIPISQEFSAEGGYSGGVLTKQGSKPLGNLDNINSHFNYVVSPQVKDGVILRFGVDAERDSFGLPNKSPLPNTLQSANLIIGADLALTDKILFRIEVHPGYYGDNGDITSSDIDVPVAVRRDLPLQQEPCSSSWAASSTINPTFPSSSCPAFAGSLRTSGCSPPSRPSRNCSLS